MLAGIEVPTVTREQMLDAIRALGIDPTTTRRLVLERGYIEVEMYAVNEHGKRVAAGDEAATAVIKIPVVDVKFAAAPPYDTVVA